MLATFIGIIPGTLRVREPRADARSHRLAAGPGLVGNAGRVRPAGRVRACCRCCWQLPCPRRSASPRALMPRLSIVVPALNEAAAHRRDARRRCSRCARAVTRSSSSTAAAATRRASARARRSPIACVVRAARTRRADERGRARSPRGDVLVFLHADSRLAAGTAGRLLAAWPGAGRALGPLRRRDRRAARRCSPLVATMMNLRSRLTGIATGDQAIFVDARAVRARRRLSRPAADGGHRDLPPR